MLILDIPMVKDSRECLLETNNFPLTSLFDSVPDPLTIKSRFFEVLGLFEKCEFKKGDYIYEIGSDSDAMYVVEAGELSLLVPFKDGFETLERMLSGTMVISKNELMK